MSESPLLASLRARQSEMIDALIPLVEHESPSRDKPALDGLADELTRRFADLGGLVDRVANAVGGDHLVVQFDGARPDRGPALVLIHFDTVWPIGTLARRPVRREGDRVFGPGIFDMKASFVLAEFALRAIRDLGLAPTRPIRFAFTSDEEIGSPTSRRLIESLARESAYVLVPEPPLPGGGLKTQRKGVGRFVVTVLGREAHAGVEPEKGLSAVVEMAHQVLAISALGDPAAGTTVNVGVVQGGTTANTIAGEATAVVDVRVASEAEASRIEAAMRGLTPVAPGAVVRVEGGMNRPPMVRTPAVAALFEQARTLARPLGLDLAEGSTGGGSDGNFTAALGVPTLDGLGTLGGGAHAEGEHILASSLPERAALLAVLLLGLKTPDDDR